MLRLSRFEIELPAYLSALGPTLARLLDGPARVRRALNRWTGRGPQVAMRCARCRAVGPFASTYAEAARAATAAGWHQTPMMRYPHCPACLAPAPESP